MKGLDMLRASLDIGRPLFATCLTVCLLAGNAIAEPPWAKLVPFKKIDADPSKTYELEEKHGPWMIMVASFVGPTAEAAVARPGAGAAAAVSRRSVHLSEDV